MPRRCSLPAGPTSGRPRSSCQQVGGGGGGPGDAAAGGTWLIADLACKPRGVARTLGPKPLTLDGRRPRGVARRPGPVGGWALDPGAGSNGQGPAGCRRPGPL